MDDGVLLRALAQRLERSDRVHRLVVRGDAASAEEMASEAADSLVDIRRSAEALRTDLLPKLLRQAPESDEFDDTLGDVAEELRHIHYHLVNTKLFSYILPTS